MIVISHRGNIKGSIVEKENHPEYIENAIKLGYEVEIDIRYKNGLYLGHDYAQYKISINWLNKFKNSIWIHCKDAESFIYVSNFKTFCHTLDPFTIVTLTDNNKLLWIHDLSVKLNNFHIIPLISKNEIDNFDLSLVKNVYGICTDYPEYLETKL